jgi:hypothetical protein
MPIARVAFTAALALSLLALTAVPAGAQGGATVAFNGGFVYHTVTIPAGETVKFDVTCPPGFRAIAGTVTTGNPSLVPLLSQPIGVPPFRVWKFGFRNGDAQRPITITVMITCFKPRPPPGVRVIRTASGVKKIVYVLPPRQKRKVNVPCPPGQAPASDTQQVDTPAGPRTAAAAQPAIAVRSVRARGNRLEQTIENVGTTEARGSAGAVCLSRAATVRERDGDRATRQVRVQALDVRFQLGPGKGAVRTGCPSGFPLDPGFTVPAGVDFLGAALGRPRSAALGFANGRGASISGQVHLVCFRDGAATFTRGAPGVVIDTTVGPITIR